MSYIIPPQRFKVRAVVNHGYTIVDTQHDEEVVDTWDPKELKVGMTQAHAGADAAAAGMDATEIGILDVEKALDLVRRVDMVMSQNRLGVISAADVTGSLFGMGFGDMTRGEILRGGGYA